MSAEMNKRNLELYERCTVTYDESGQSEPWRNEVAKDLNNLLARAEYALATTADESDVMFVESCLRIVDRVASFEDIQLADSQA